MNNGDARKGWEKIISEHEMRKEEEHGKKMQRREGRIRQQREGE